MGQLTEEQFKEFIKCRRSFKYFSETYLQITHPKKGLVPFQLYDFQKRTIEEFETNQYCIVKKFRQAGLTTVTSMWMLWKCLFFTDQRILIASKTDREAKAVGKTIAQAKQNLPEWLQPEMQNDNDHEKEFAETRSVMWFYTPAAARSRALTYLIIDEAAFVQGMEEHWKSMYPTLSTGGNAIIISTVNGIGGVGAWYHEQYQKAIDKRSQFHVVHIDWHEHPDYNNAEWEKRTRANIGEKGFAQEYEGSFLGSGETYIPSEVIREYEKECCDPVKKMMGEWDTSPTEDASEEDLPNKNYEAGAMWVWDMPRAGKEYVITVDAAMGVGDDGDQCAFIVMDLATLTQVGEFYSKTIPTYKFSQVLAQIGKMYNNALIVVENSMGPGQAVCERLQHNLAYENLYFTQGATRDRAGVNMNKVLRPMCMEALQTCMLNRIVKIRSIRIIRELLTFVYNKSRQRAEAQKNKHDDLVICLSMALYVADILNRETPVGGSTETTLIEKTFSTDNQELLALYRELESGIGTADFFDYISDDVDLLPKLSINGYDLDNRPNGKTLKEFGW